MWKEQGVSSFQIYLKKINYKFHNYGSVIHVHLQQIVGEGTCEFYG